MQQKFHHGGRTYRVGRPFTKAELRRVLVSSRVREGMWRGDLIDARAMLAREVAAERVWRIGCVCLRPADCVRRELASGEPLREIIERDCGEALT